MQTRQKARSQREALAAAEAAELARSPNSRCPRRSGRPKDDSSAQDSHQKLVEELGRAARRGQTKRVGHLVHGLGVDVCSVFTHGTGSCALLEAITWGHTETAEFLLRAGADPNQQDRSTTHPVLLAATRGLWGLVNLLLESGATPQLAVAHAYFKRRNGLALPILHAAAQHTPPSKGNGLVAIAIIMKERKVVEDLLQRGFNPNTASRLPFSGYGTPLTFACDQGDVELVKQLLSHGADPNLRYSACGWYPLKAAATAGHAELVSMLIDAGAEVDATSSMGDTALMRAAESGHLAVVKLLVEGGADVNLTKGNGLSALQIGAARGHREVALVLLRSGAVLQAENLSQVDLHVPSNLIQWQRDECLRLAEENLKYQKMIHTVLPQWCSVAASRRPSA